MCLCFMWYAILKGSSNHTKENNVISKTGKTMLWLIAIR